LKRPSEIFWVCWFTYFTAYLCRSNFSIALPEMIEEGVVDYVQAAMIGSVFYWVYAFGQLINGRLGDKLDSSKMVGAGLTLSAVLNLVTGSVREYFQILGAWSVNAFALSMLWGPIMRVLSHVTPQEARGRTASKISTSMIAGYIASWGGIGWLLRFSSWRLAFWLPSAAVVPALTLVKRLRTVSKPLEVSHTHVKDEIRVVFKDLRFHLLIGLTVFQGILRNALMLWIPVLLRDVYSASPNLIASSSVLIQLIAFVGISTVGILEKKANLRDSSQLIVFFLLSTISLVGLSVEKGGNLLIGGGLLGVSLATMYGANTVLLGSVPLSFGNKGMASTVAGALDFVSYAAGGTAIIALSPIIEEAGWHAIELIWGVIALMGTVTALFLNLSRNV